MWTRGARPSAAGPGEEEPTWILLVETGRPGPVTRIGLEDVLHGPTGDPVGGNPVLVGLARARLT